LGCFKPKTDSYPPLCPDFVVELRSPTDKLEELRAKCEYINNGARLGWLINPQECQVEIYRQGQDAGSSVAYHLGEDVLPGFMLELKGVFKLCKTGMIPSLLAVVHRRRLVLS